MQVYIFAGKSNVQSFEATTTRRPEKTGVVSPSEHMYIVQLCPATYSVFHMYSNMLEAPKRGPLAKTS